MTARVSQGWTWIESWANFFLFYMLFLHQESPKKMLFDYYGKCSLVKFVWDLLHISNGTFCVWIKSVRNDFSIELTETQQYPRDKDPFQYSCGFLHRGVRFIGLLWRKDVVDRKRSRRKGEREEIKSCENREFEQCAEVESSENEPRKTDQPSMDKIIKALTTDEKKTPKNFRNRSSSGDGSWKSPLRKPLLVAR